MGKDQQRHMDLRGDLNEAAYYLSALSMIVSGILAIKGDSLGPRGCETVWWLTMKVDGILDGAMTALDAAQGTPGAVGGGTADG